MSDRDENETREAMIPERFPVEAGPMSCKEFKAWWAKHWPETKLTLPRQSRDVILAPPVYEIQLGIAHNLSCRMYGGRYYINKCY